MKLYTSQNSQFGKKILVLNSPVEFDHFGCAEVDSELGSKIIMTYPEWYSDKKFSKKEEVNIAVESSKELELKNKEIEKLKDEIEKLKRFDEDRKFEISLKEDQIKDLQTSLESVSTNMIDSDNKFKEATELWNKKEETYKTRIELMDLKAEELKETASLLKIPEKEFINLKRPALIDLIVKKTHNIE